ncbi:DUF192 domain-containing protein [Alcaligenes sp. WGS1538]|uniref:DUF192 domain-containing protein n=1 Tax=Alcaligenes sp. WGS1538 TaxID=3366811 RepID=UPI00372D41A5
MHCSRITTGPRRPVFFACSLAALLLAGVAKAQDPLPMRTLTLGERTIQAEVADRPETRAMGLMDRQNLAPDHGMLFVFEQEGMPCFWMKNTPLPLDIAFIDQEGFIANIAAMQPFDLQSHCPVRPIRYALEMEQGWFAKADKQAGERVVGLPR